jgi:hypothetical protein
VLRANGRWRDADDAEDGVLDISMGLEAREHMGESRCASTAVEWLL